MATPAGTDPQHVELADLCAALAMTFAALEAKLRTGRPLHASAVSAATNRIFRHEEAGGDAQG